MSKKLINDCKKYLGLPPYDDDSNKLWGDDRFYIALCKKYGEESVDDTIQQLESEQ